jgi:tripartite-type tricarboxylate transporter receptor subunit TctC
MTRLLLLIAFCASLIAASTSIASAQDDRNAVRLVVPYAPGGFPDTISRLVASRLETDTGQAYVIENRPGGAGAIAAEYVANAAPDGHTLLVADAQQWAIAPAMFNNLKYDPKKDFAPVTLLGTAGNFLVVSSDLGIANFQDLVAQIKANPSKFNYGTPGVGSIHQLTFEALKARLGLKMIHVPYKGGGEVIPALLSNQVQLALQALPSITAFAEQGKLKILAVTMAERSKFRPDVPTLEELGAPDMDFPGAIGILAPAGTPPATVSRLAVAMKNALTAPPIVEKLATFAIAPSGMSPAEFKTWIDSDIVKFKAAVQDAGLEPH